MIEPQIYQMLVELIECGGKDPVVRENLNKWRKKYIREYHVREIIGPDFHLMHNPDLFLDHVKTKLGYKLGEAIVNGPLSVFNDITFGENETYRTGMRQLEYKILVLGVDDAKPR